MLSLLKLAPLLGLLACAQGMAATLTAGQVDAKRDTTITVPLTLGLGGDDKIAGFQGDIHFEPKALSLVTISPGPAAVETKKNVSYSTVSRGHVRLILAGLNQNLMHNGIVANIVFRVASQTASGRQAITFEKVTAADANGGPASLSASSGYVNVCPQEEEPHPQLQTGCSCLGARADMIEPPPVGDVLPVALLAFALLLRPHRRLLRRGGHTAYCTER